MERKLNIKVEQYLSSFKDSIRDKVTEMDLQDTSKIKAENLLEFIYNYERLVIDKDDLTNRKRIKNVVPFFERCSSKRANNEQCSRRKKDGFDYCGTHIKGTPHGIMTMTNGTPDEPTTQKLEVWAQDIQGIVYYLDKNGNVYQTEDIVSNSVTPKIIAKYVKSGSDEYHIPEFGI
jgi:hypothetical protein